MADFPDDASPSTSAVRRSSAPLPPFVSPRGNGGIARRTPHPAAPVHEGHRVRARLYTPPGAMAVHDTADGRAYGAEMTGGEQPEPAAQPDVEPIETEAAPWVGTAHDGEPAGYDEAVVEAVSVAGTQMAEAAQLAESAAVEFDRPESVYAQSAGSEPASTASADSEWAGSESAGSESAVSQPVDDDWFATETSEPDAPPEPMRPTPAFNDLRGIERLASEAGSYRSPFSSPTEAEAAAVGPNWSSVRDPQVVVADVLERMALRVREGDLSLPADIALPSDAAALAAVLTALLRSPQG